MVAEEFGDTDAGALIVRSGDPVAGTAILQPAARDQGALFRLDGSGRRPSVDLVGAGRGGSLAAVGAGTEPRDARRQPAGLDRCSVLHVVEPSDLGYDETERTNLMRSLERFMSPIELHDVSVVPEIE